MEPFSRPFRRALLIAIIYAVAGAAWIAFSDRLVEAVADSPMTMTRLQTLKGWAFVILSAGLVLMMCVVDMRREHALSRSALAEKEVLLAEIHHRVRNNLQLIVSLLSLESARLTDGKARDALADSLVRVQAIGLVHHHLYESRDFGRIDFATYARDLCGSVAATAPNGVALSFDLVPFVCDPARVIPLGMILVELVTNALKHGYPDGRTGTVMVRLTCTGTLLALEVADDGIGLVDGHAEQATSGLTLVRMMAEQLHGRLSHALGPSGGARFRVELDAGAVTPSPSPP